MESERPFAARDTGGSLADLSAVRREYSVHASAAKAPGKEGGESTFAAPCTKVRSTGNPPLVLRARSCQVSGLLSGPRAANCGLQGNMRTEPT